MESAHSESVPGASNCIEMFEVMGTAGDKREKLGRHLGDTASVRAPFDELRRRPDHSFKAVRIFDGRTNQICMERIEIMRVARRDRRYCKPASPLHLDQPFADQTVKRVPDRRDARPELVGHGLNGQRQPWRKMAAHDQLFDVPVEAICRESFGRHG